MNVFKCFAYPVCWLTVQGFTCLQIKWGHTAPKSCFPFFSTFLLFEIPLECNCASVGLQNVSESFTNSAGTSGGKKPNMKYNKRKYHSSVESTLFILSHSFSNNTSSTAHLELASETGSIYVLNRHSSWLRTEMVRLSHHIKWLYLQYQALTLLSTTSKKALFTL